MRASPLALLRAPASGRAAPVLGAIALHLLGAAVVLVLGLKPIEGIRGPGAVPVHLVSGAPNNAADATAARPQTTSQEMFQDLARQLTKMEPAPQVSSSPPSTSLSEILGMATASTAGAQVQRTVGPGDGAVVDDPYSRASLGPGSIQRSGDDPIRVKAQSCWRGDRAPRPVRVEVRLSTSGTLLGEPRVTRSPLAAADAAQISAERRALRAVLDCAPYPLPRDFRPAALYGLELG